MSADHPNYLRYSSGEISFGVAFGPVSTVTPIHFTGRGHQPWIEARFEGGARVTFTPKHFIELLREGQQALAKLPHYPDVPDAVGGVE